jgi:hypothetical protein
MQFKGPLEMCDQEIDRGGGKAGGAEMLAKSGADVERVSTQSSSGANVVFGGGGSETLRPYQFSAAPLHFKA